MKRIGSGQIITIPEAEISGHFAVDSLGNFITTYFLGVT